MCEYACISLCTCVCESLCVCMHVCTCVCDYVFIKRLGEIFPRSHLPWEHRQVDVWEFKAALLLSVPLAYPSDVATKAIKSAETDSRCYRGACGQLNWGKSCAKEAVTEGYKGSLPQSRALPKAPLVPAS